MQRYFISTDQIDHEYVRLQNEQVHHIVHVMRSKVEDLIICSDGLGHDYLVKIIQLDKDYVLGQVVEFLTATNELPVRVSVAQALPKGDKMDLIIQKCTELGAMEFFPFRSARTIVKFDEKKSLKRIERWQKIAKEAAEQSHRSMIPAIHPPLQWQSLLPLARKFDCTLFAYEQENNHSLYQTLQTQSSLQSILVIIGPEGGFAQQEVEQAAQSGCIPISLGKRILRTETASLFTLASIAYHFEQVFPS